MKVILLEDVPKVGNRHEIKDLKPGYARNVLIRQGLAELATPEALARLENIKFTISSKKEKADKNFDELIDNVNKKVIIIEKKANENGSLFSAVSKKDIIKEVEGLKEENIILNPIKELGEFKVKVKKGDREGEFTIKIESQK
ncbi:MAG: 50S ribosomal protein L9 [Patescibacteria group bacterium]|nr:50S ribosomal protein L9 [Patescibacteria group bacterium]